MLVDPPSLKVISSCCALSDVLDEGIELIEVLTKRREPLRSKNVLCILSNDKYLDILFKDFIPGKENYLGVFLMFNCHMKDDKILRKIAQNIDFNKILGCVELFLNFVPFESNIFFTQIHSINSLYTNNNLNDYINSVTSKIISLCNVLNLLPNIYYYASGTSSTTSTTNSTTTNTNTNTTNTNTNTNTNSINKTIKMLCKKLKEKLNETLRGKNMKNCDLIIFDRSIDFTPLFIHEYSYQAFVYDLLNIPYCSQDTIERMDQMDGVSGASGRMSGSGNRMDGMNKVNRMDNCYEYIVVGMDNREKRIALLDSELDILWCKYRHMHIQEVNTLVLNEIDKFKKSGTGKMNMLEQIRNLPNLQYLIEKYWAHLNLTNECFEVVQRYNLIKINELEQIMSTSLDNNKKHISHTKIFDKLVEILGKYEKNQRINSFQLKQGPDKKLLLQSRDGGSGVGGVGGKGEGVGVGGGKSGTVGASTVTEEDKIRLLMIYLCNYNIGMNGLKEILKEIRLDDKSVQILQKIIQSLPIIKSNDGKIIHQLTNDMINYYKKLNTEYDSSRYISYLIYTVQQYIKHFHHENILSYDGRGGGGSDGISGKGNEGTSLGGAVGASTVMDKKILELKTFDVLIEKEEIDDRRKLIIYVLGGITFSECREIYKIINKKNIDVYFGGDEIIIPSQFLNYFH
ncbi:syntaxin binding protein 2, putative [Theileria annulata]|uniref:Syntaxin binding protein 2, putative n=1 Tax=Theileria annulata TaxID=5874 RepID=Q4UCW5_THEAN|nr:syntaxin binding protein 2, putative [Theileria annulata]CAI75336.1 syntaxin binding protein 2, putative [Theileria annulata]|eukprot:XP_954812.1 syntaxin binding protein 2, putative [Theileria annulata]